jgi:uncharacterized protein involved in type VI secretion and phage assembly
MADMRTPSITINGEDDWTLRSAEIVEAMCTPGVTHVDVLTKRDNIHPADYLDKTVSIEIPTLVEDQPTRYVNGIVWSWSTVGPFREGSGLYQHRILVAPPLLRLSLRSHSRGYNGCSILQAVNQVFSDYGQRAPLDNNSKLMVLGDEPCDVPLLALHQHECSDLHFVSGQLHAANVFWFTRHTEPGGRVGATTVLGTQSVAAMPWAKSATMQWNPSVTDTAFEPAVIEWHMHACQDVQVPVVSSFNEYDATHAMPTNASALAASPGDESFKPMSTFNLGLGRPVDSSRTLAQRDQLSKSLEASLALERHWATGIATSAAVAPGHALTIDGLPGGAPSEWFVVSTRMIIAGPGVGAGTDVDEPRLLCGIRAIPLNVPFRPPQRLDRLSPPDLCNHAASAATPRRLDLPS